MTSNQHNFRGRVGRGVPWAAELLYRPDRYVSETDMFYAAVESHLSPSAVVLDAGCGDGGAFAHDWRGRVASIAGCDEDPAAARNPYIDAFALASLERLPFDSASFDLVLSRYVLEHIQHPEAAFAEIARVLKPGGHFVVLTPNKWHYVTLISRLMPFAAHRGLGRLLRGKAPEEMFPTVYRANDEPTLRSLGTDAGMILSSFVAYETRPNYLTFALPAFLLGAAYERVVNGLRALRRFRVSLIATFQRNAQ